MNAAPPEKPVALIPGLGTYTHTIATRSPEAQKFFNQGLNLLYGFNRYEALRSFRRAAELDPSAAMPHWGIAMAQAPYINMDLDGDFHPKESCDAIRDGLALRDGVPARERAYLEAANKRCPDGASPPYIAAMRALAQLYPDDLDAATFFAESLLIPTRWKWWSADGRPAAGTEEAVRVLDQVLRHDADHPGANHLYIHAVEASPTPERAIPSAQRLMGVVPAAGHLVHMPAHIWLLLGEYELAADVNERAAALDQKYFDATGVMSPYMGYMMHNVDFVGYARAMQGRKDDAFRAAQKLADGAAPMAQAMPQIVDAVMPRPLFALLRFNRWDEILDAKPSDPSLHSATALWHYARALAFNAKHRAEDVRREKEAFYAGVRALPADWPWSNNKAADALALAGETLEARLAANADAAIPHWRRAIEIQDGLVYDEPPPWYYPIRESLGAALLRAGKAAEAEQAFRAGLRRSPRNGRMLFGLMTSLEAQNNNDAAALVRREFDRAWKKADVTLKIDDL
jgi:tetratricopeptide (TPR) repeat protein